MLRAFYKVTNELVCQAVNPEFSSTFPSATAILYILEQGEKIGKAFCWNCRFYSKKTEVALI